MKKVIALLIVLNCAALAQVVYVDPAEDVYDFLERLSLKHIINFNNETFPKSRREIASLLLEANEKSSSLTSLESEELHWHLIEYSSNEYSRIRSAEERWYPYSYTDSLFRLAVLPIAGYGLSSFGDKGGNNKLVGAKLWGTYSDWFGASFEYADRGEFGSNVDAEKLNTRTTGHNYKTAPNGLEFSDVKGSINFNWACGSVSLRKDYNMWGHGNFGQLFVSAKPASYPHILLTIKPAPWFRFSYFHGWLNSLILDSASFYYNHIELQLPHLRRKYVDKYIAANMLTITPWQWLDFSIGNSAIYSGSLRPEMFIPFMYYKVMDHNTGREDFDDSNGQIFADVKFSYLKNFAFYSSLLIDVLELREILKGTWYTSWFGYTLGGKYTGLVPGLTLTAEYSKTNPWVYENSDQSTDYKHLGYSLGHWIGQNADLFSFQADYRLLRGLNLSLTLESFRQGGLKDLLYAYKIVTDEAFLYSPLRRDKSVRLDVFYEPIYDLVVNGFYRYSYIRDENVTRTPEWQKGDKHSFSINVTYGL